MALLSLLVPFVARPWSFGTTVEGLPMARHRRLEMIANTTDPAAPSADALIVFGATGDLARKKIFPALHAMSRCGALRVPVIVVGSSKWNVEQLSASA